MIQSRLAIALVLKQPVARLKICTIAIFFFLLLACLPARLVVVQATDLARREPKKTRWGADVAAGEIAGAGEAALVEEAPVTEEKSAHVSRPKPKKRRWGADEQDAAQPEHAARTGQVPADPEAPSKEEPNVSEGKSEPAKADRVQPKRRRWGADAEEPQIAGEVASTEQVLVLESEPAQALRPLPKRRRWGADEAAADALKVVDSADVRKDESHLQQNGIRPEPDTQRQDAATEENVMDELAERSHEYTAQGVGDAGIGVIEPAERFMLPEGMDPLSVVLLRRAEAAAATAAAASESATDSGTSAAKDIDREAAEATTVSSANHPTAAAPPPAAPSAALSKVQALRQVFEPVGGAAQPATIQTGSHRPGAQRPLPRFGRPDAAWPAPGARELELLEQASALAAEVAAEQRAVAQRRGQPDQAQQQAAAAVAGGAPPLMVSSAEGFPSYTSETAAYLAAAVNAHMETPVESEPAGPPQPDSAAQPAASQPDPAKHAATALSASTAAMSAQPAVAPWQQPQQEHVETTADPAAPSEHDADAPGTEGEPAPPGVESAEEQPAATSQPYAYDYAAYQYGYYGAANPYAAYAAAAYGGHYDPYAAYSAAAAGADHAGCCSGLIASASFMRICCPVWHHA